MPDEIEVKDRDLILVRYRKLETYDQVVQIKKQIQRGLDASNDSSAPRTAHADFMAELKTELMSRIDAQ